MCDNAMLYATEEHAPQILECLVAAFQPYKDQYTPAAYDDAVPSENTIIERMRDMEVVLAVIDGKVAGMMALQVKVHKVGASVLQDREMNVVAFLDGFDIATRKRGHIQGIAVFPEFQGSGVAERLLKAAERSFKNRECTHVTLETAEPLRRARRFYEKHGYGPTGQVSDFHGMPLIELAKELKNQSQKKSGSTQPPTSESST